MSSTANICAWLISYFSSVYSFSHWLVFLGEKLSKATLHIYIIFYLWCSRKKIICLCEHYEKRVGNISTLYTNKIDLGSRISRTHMHICINQSHHYSFFIHSSVDFAMFSLALSLAISNCDVFFFAWILTVYVFLSLAIRLLALLSFTWAREISIHFN